MAISLPAKVLRVSITAEQGLERWPYDDGQGDRWWADGSSPRFYRWDLTVTVTPQVHSSHLTREHYTYNAFDIKVGDWIARASTGTACKIIGTRSKSETEIIITVEDVNRYNTFRDTSSLGNGNLGTGIAIVFGLNEEGEPLLDAISAGVVSESFFMNLMSRFQNLNKEYDYNLTQLGNTFEIGDIIAADTGNGGWTLSNSSFPYVIGRVSAMGPGPNDFYVTPIQTIIDDFDSLPGSAGELLYLDSVNAGQITTSQTDHVMYVKLKDHTVTSIVGEISPISVTDGSALDINGTTVTFATGDEATVLSSINALTSTHGVTASSVAAPNTTTVNSGDLNYGITGALGDVQSADINGVIVTFDITTEGTVAFGTTAANAADMAAAINRDMVDASNTDITAEEANDQLYITSASGQAITITNITTDTSGVSFAGPSSSTGIPLSTAASSDTYIKLTGSDAGPIELANSIGTPMEELGVYTVENGQKAAALYVEQGIRTVGGGETGGSSMTVVADISARDQLSPVIGDQVFVTNTGNGEWAVYMWNSSAWVMLVDQDAAATDAQTISIEITPSTSAQEIIGTVSDSSRVTLISIEVVEAFDTVPTLTVGDQQDLDRLFLDDWHDLSQTETFTAQPSYQYTSGSDVDIIVSFDANGATTGRAIINVSYM